MMPANNNVNDAAMRVLKRQILIYTKTVTFLNNLGRSAKPKSWKSKNGQADYLPRHSPDVRTVFEI